MKESFICSERSLAPEYIRVSVGTAVILGLEQMQVDAQPTTAYLMLYTEGRCLANCGFCPQARESKARIDSLARIFWPKYTLQEVKRAFESLPKSERFERLCVQVINYAGFFEDLVGVINALNHLDIPISVSVQPLKEMQLSQLHQIGVDRVGIPLDAATETLFYEVKGKGGKGPYKWERNLENLRIAQRIFGKEKVSTHLIIGLGETEFEAIQFLQTMIDSDVLPALFTFTPIRGTRFEKMSRPSLFQYRKIQLARYLLLKKQSRVEDFSFNEEGDIIDYGSPLEQLKEVIQMGTPFLTSGCPGCNRPYYNERPGETLYNYPKQLNNREINGILQLFQEKMG
jgi:biotin synthase-related radical SAM superfamily protein